MNSTKFHYAALPLDALHLNEGNIRKGGVHKGEIEQLATSIRVVGLLTPLIGDGQYGVIAGGRRLAVSSVKSMASNSSKDRPLKARASSIAASSLSSVT